MHVDGNNSFRNRTGTDYVIFYSSFQEGLPAMSLNIPR